LTNILDKNKFKIFYISPKEIKYCIFPSKYCDYTQYGLKKNHPHAGKDRGVFREDPKGFIKINSSNWDNKPGVLFASLLEYKALLNHFKGKQNWKHSKFAKRYVNYVKINKIKDRGLDYKNISKFLIEREKQINRLFDSIKKDSIYPTDIKKNKKLFLDNISVVLTKNNKLYFNNRGHHRLSIAKIIGLEKVPVKISVAKSEEELKKFLFKIRN
tara:strand:+ start:5611 stop:6252 length:642 start_codon:yes stop_codon:yes gene_type:complete